MTLPEHEPDNLQLLGNLAADIGGYACEMSHGPFGRTGHGTPAGACLVRRSVTEYAYDLLRAHSARVQRTPGESRAECHHEWHWSLTPSPYDCPSCGGGDRGFDE